MSAYDSVDPVIEKWVSALGTTLCTEWAGETARFFYMPGDPPFEVFQINISPPVGDRLQVFAHAVDTNDDTDEGMACDWSGSTDELDGMIQLAVTTVNGWQSRNRKKPDPPSPW
jgi:hypothetical protein